MQSVNNEVQPLCNGDYLAEVLRLFLQWKLGFERETVLYSLIKVRTANISGYILFDSKKNEPCKCQCSSVVELLTCNERVGGSNPSIGSIVFVKDSNSNHLTILRQWFRY